MNRQNWIRLLSKAVAIAWALLLVTLPVTSFPFFPSGLGGETLVRPLSLYPLLVLCTLVTLPDLFRRRLPRTFLPLFAFCIIALISSALALTKGSDVFLGISLPARILRNLITLGIGTAYFLTVSLVPKSWEELRSSLRWLYTGFGIALAWGTLQVVYVVYLYPPYFELVKMLQTYISTRRLFATRISGMTYEPKWFADQICFLLLPWLLSAVLQKQSVFKWRYRWITVEFILLIWSVIVMLFTFSRTGIAILVGYAFVIFFLFRSRRASHEETIRSKSWQRRRVVEAIVAVCVLGLVIVGVGSQNRYFSRFWTYFTEPERIGPNRTYLEYIGFRQRFAYAETAFRIYEAFPVLGAGLGSYAFYFDEMLPDLPWSRFPEIIRYITPDEDAPRLITPKNLYARLLAETGLIGTIVFITFVLAVLGCALYLWYSPIGDQKFWGIGGILALLVFPILILSIDSFALPNMWVIFGLITAAAHLSPSSDSVSISNTNHQQSTQ
jgi:hypothetical protein